jgi:hypothetical protein
VHDPLVVRAVKLIEGGPNWDHESAGALLLDGTRATWADQQAVVLIIETLAQPVIVLRHGAMRSRVVFRSTAACRVRIASVDAGCEHVGASELALERFAVSLLSSRDPSPARCSNRCWPDRLVVRCAPSPIAPAMLPFSAIVIVTPWSFDPWCIARNNANQSAQRVRCGKSPQT